MIPVKLPTQQNAQNPLYFQANTSGDNNRTGRILFFQQRNVYHHATRMNRSLTFVLLP